MTWTGDGRRTGTGGPPAASVTAAARARGPVGERATTVAAAAGVWDLVRDVAQWMGDTPAIVDCGATLSYPELVRSVLALRGELATAGCRAGDVVGVEGRRGTGRILAFLAIESLHAVYLPLDPQWPAARRDAVLVRVRPRFAVDADRDAARAVQALPPRAAGTGPPVPAAGADEPCYVIFTSGSTGRPKGAVVARGGFTNHLASLIERLELTERDRVAFTAPSGFVVSLWQMVAALLVGGCVVTATDRDVAFGRSLAAFAGRSGITVLELVPTALGWLTDALSRGPHPGLPALRCLVSTGEPLRVDLAAATGAALPGVTLFDAYGASEVSDDIAVHRVEPTDLERPRLPLGAPVANTSLYVLVPQDGAWRPAREGETGELWVGGAQVGLGYWGEPDLTARAFVEDRWDPSSATGRLYRTGDVCAVEGGRLFCLGRLDRQIKIAGVRMEPAEIESVLARIPGIVRAAVRRQERRGQVELVAHYEGASPLPERHLRDHALRLLPVVMVPRRWVHNARLPTNANGKVDYSALETVGPS